jgi:hypothetical protein
MIAHRRHLAALAVAAATLAAGGAAAAETRRYAMVIGHTTDLERRLPALEYADDDAARYHELFGQVADEVRVYTVLDEPSQRLFPAVARVARVPRRAEVLAGLRELFAAMERDRAAGRDVVFYFVLVGHGEIGPGGEGHVSLLDGTFSRTDLFHQVLARSPATTNHVVVDACNAYFLVHRRGPDAVDDAGPGRPDAVQAFVSREELARYPNTGVLLSTSGEKESHEWSVYRAGVFSHQLRSAMLGLADVNEDGAVEYSEVEAYLAAANHHVADPGARLTIFAQPPAVDAGRPLIDLRASRFRHWLHVPAGPPLRFYLEDRRGVRYVDAHVGREQPALIGLMPGTGYHLRTSDDAHEIAIVPGASPRIDLDRRALRRPRIAARGALEDSFRAHLYQEPFGRDFYRGFAAAWSARAVDLDAPRWRPGPADAAFVDHELRRVNRASARDPALRQRLTAAASQLARLLAADRHDEVLVHLRRLERDPP